MGGRADRRTALLVLLFLAAFWLRLFRLGNQPVWYDETYSIAVARHPVAEVAGWVYRDNHPVLYWFLLYPIVHLLGDGEFLVRFPSALLGTLTVPLLWAAGRRMLGSRQAGLLAAVWLAVSPIHVMYSQEARMYALLTFCGLASTLFLYLAMTRGKVTTWIVFGAMAAATAHSHNYGLLLLGAQDCWALVRILVVRSRRSVLGLGLSHLVFAVLYAPMVPALLNQMQMSIGSTGVATLRDVLDVFEAFAAGLAGFSTPGLTPDVLIRGAALPAVVLTVGLMLLGLLAGGRSSTERRWALGLTVTCLLLPILAVYGYSVLFHKAVWQVRGFQMALGCFALLVAAGLASLRPRMVRWAALLSLMAVAALNLYPHYFERYKSTVPDAVAALEGQLGNEDVIFVAPDWMWLPFRYYYRGNVDAIGGRSQGETLHFVGVGTDYADLIEPRALDIDPTVRHPILSPQEFRAEDYARVWTVGHMATPQNVLSLFGEDVTIMHYDLGERRWRAVVYPATYAADPSRLPLAVETPGLCWESGLCILGYTWNSPLVVGQRSRLTLFWTAKRSQEHTAHLEVRLVDQNQHVDIQQTTPMVSILHGIPMISMGIFTTFPTTAWPVGGVVVQDIELTIPPDLPPLSYQVNLRLIDENRGEPLHIAGETEATLDRVSVTRPPEPCPPHRVAVQHRTDILFAGQIRLFGYDLPEATPRPGHYLPVWLHWVAEKPPNADYEVQLRLLDRNGAVLAEGSGLPSTPAFPTTMWQAGDLSQSELVIPLPPDMKGGRYRLAARLVNAVTGKPVLGRRGWTSRPQEWVVMGWAEVADWPLVTEPPPMAYETEARFGEAVRLLGYDLTGNLAPGGDLTITLYWRVEAPLKKSYAVFVHLTDEAGALVAQADGIPVGWLRPTTTWRPGEVITDSYSLPLPANLPGGVFRLYVGFYDPEGGPRLPAVSRGQSVPDGRVLIGLIAGSSDGGE